VFVNGSSGQIGFEILESGEFFTTKKGKIRSFNLYELVKISFVSAHLGHLSGRV
jgi:hypothetical protein